MGWIRPSNPAQQLHRLAANVEVERTSSEKKSAEASISPHKSESKTDEHDSYPIQPWRTNDKDLPFIPAAEVKKRDGKDGNRLFIVVDGIVLDTTIYVSKHPGGRQIIQGFAGQECGWQWWTFHNRKVWDEVATTLRVGRTEGIENKHVRPKAFIGLRGLGYQDDWA